MSEWAAKRFWTEVSVASTGGGFSVLLDGRPIRTPGRAPLDLPTEALAEAMAAEWAAQEGTVDPRTMPVTRTANSAIDKVRPQQEAVADMLAAYGETDLLCHRADRPPELVARQAAAWDPLLDWAAEVFGGRLRVTAGVMPAPQDAALLLRLRDGVRALSAFELAAFHDLVSLSGSLVIGFATARGHRPAEALWEVSRIDESWQAEQWGEDAEAAKDAEGKRDAFLHAARFYRSAQKSG